MRARPAIKLQSFARALLERERIRQTFVAELAPKLEGLLKLAAVVAKAKGADNFVPPLDATLRPLLIKFLLCFTRRPTKALLQKEVEVISALFGFVKRSLHAADPALNVKNGLPGHARRLAACFFHLSSLCDLPGPLREDLTAAALELGLPSSSDLKPLYVTKNIERLLAFASADASLGRIQQRAAIQPEGFVATALQALQLQAQASPSTLSATDLCRLSSAILACPFAFKRLGFDDEESNISAGSRKLRCKETEESKAPLLVPIWERLLKEALNLLVTNRGALDQQFKRYLSLGGSSSPSRVANRAHGPAVAASTAVAAASTASPAISTPATPSAALTSTFGMFGLKASATGVVATPAAAVPFSPSSTPAPASAAPTASPATRPALMPTPAPHRLPPSSLSQLQAWPVESFIVGNVLQLLSASASASAGLPSASGKHQQPFVSFLSRDALLDAVRIIIVCRDALPSSVWHTAVPLSWPSPTVPGGAAPPPIPMPPLLVSQLRMMSREAFNKALAKRCCWLNPSKLKLSGMRLADDNDPEAGTYDAHTVDVGATGHQERGVKGKGTSLSSAPSAATSIVRGGLSLLRRLANSVTGGSSGAKAAGSSSSAQSSAATAGAGAGSAATLPASVLSPALVPLKKQKKLSAEAIASEEPFDRELFELFVRLYTPLLLPRPQQVGAAGPLTAGSSLDSDPIFGRLHVLNALVYSPSLSLCRVLWAFCGELAAESSTSSSAPFADLVGKRAFKSIWLSPSSSSLSLLECAVSLFASSLAHFLPVADDIELHTSSAFPLRELRVVIRLFRDLIAHSEGIGCDDDTAGEVRRRLNASPSEGWSRFAISASSCLRMLYDRHCLRPLGPQSMWLIDCSKVALTLPPSATADGKLSSYDAAINSLLRVMPFAVPFETRSAMFEAQRQQELMRCQRGNPQVPVTVQRAFLFQTAFSGLKGHRGEAWRRKIAVTFLNEEGVVESGLDAGGLFKELLTSLSNLVFDPSYGLFRLTEDGQLYPNPSSNLCAGLDTGDGDDTALFEFIGRIIGKALFEGITLGPQFATFFLHKLLGRSLNVHYLPSLDADLYRSLMFLKGYQGDVENDLSLTFTAAADDVGAGVEVELVPGGGRIPVTAKNRLHYIQLVTTWRLETSMKRQTEAFRRGLMDVLPFSLAAFSAPEVQVLLSGSQRGIDLADLQRYCQYGSGYWHHDATIRALWEVLEGFSEEDKRAFLRFVTASERAPPNGFRQLYPPFTIVKLERPGGGSAAGEYLPQASTCFNTLKLPPQPDKKKLKEKLLAAIHSGSGFELT